MRDGRGERRLTGEGVRGKWEAPLGAAPDVWAVFVQGRRRDAHVYAGDVHAPDAEMALVLAKENYTRRDPCVSLWVVRADQIHATGPAAAEMFVPATATPLAPRGVFMRPTFCQRFCAGSYCHVFPSMKDEPTRIAPTT